MKTVSTKPAEVSRDWYVVDAEGLTLGRLATEIARRLRGKHKPEYTPHVDTGDYIVVVNADRVNVTGNKAQDKMYYRHTGYPGGIKITTPEKLRQKKPEEVLRLAVKRMLPGGALGKKQLSKLKVYVGENHPHESQSPELIDVSKLNNKNIVRN